MGPGLGPRRPPQWPTACTLDSTSLQRWLKSSAPTGPRAKPDAPRAAGPPSGSLRAGRRSRDRQAHRRATNRPARRRAGRGGALRMSGAGRSPARGGRRVRWLSTWAWGAGPSGGLSRRRPAPSAQGEGSQGSAFSPRTRRLSSSGGTRAAGRPSRSVGRANATAPLAATRQWRATRRVCARRKGYGRARSAQGRRSRWSQRRRTHP
jgi:hypothetical protein